MLHIDCNSETLIIDLTVNFCELHLFAYSQKMCRGG